MKILKTILLFVILLIAIPLVLALFIKKEFSVEKETVVSKPLNDVFNYVKLLKNQDNYSVWNQADPNMKKTYTGTDGTVGFIAAWESANKEVGAGEQEIINLEDNKRVDMKLRFKVPFESNDDAYMTTSAVDSTTTKITWGFKGISKYPFNLMFWAMDMEKTLGGDLQKGLDNLKVILEK